MCLDRSYDITEIDQACTLDLTEMFVQFYEILKILSQVWLFLSPANRKLRQSWDEFTIK